MELIEIVLIVTFIIQIALLFSVMSMHEKLEILKKSIKNYHEHGVDIIKNENHKDLISRLDSILNKKLKP